MLRQGLPEGLNSNTQWFLLSHPSGSAGTGTRTVLSSTATSTSHHLLPLCMLHTRALQRLKNKHNLYVIPVELKRPPTSAQRGPVCAARAAETQAPLSPASPSFCPKHPNQQSFIVPTNCAHFDHKPRRSALLRSSASRSEMSVCRHNSL